MIEVLQATHTFDIDFQSNKYTQVSKTHIE